MSIARFKYKAEYWLPRAKTRLEKLKPLGKDYPAMSHLPASLCFDPDNSLYLARTEALLNTLGPEFPGCNPDIIAWVYVKLRLEWSCEVIYGKE